MIARPPFRKTLLSLLVSGAAITMPEARAAQCETTTDADGNVTTTAGVCDGYRNNAPIDGDFTNQSTIEIPDNQTKGIRISNSYVDSLFNAGSITGEGAGDWGMYFNNLQFVAIDNQANIETVEKGIEVKQNNVSAGSVMNRANINAYGDAINIALRNNALLTDITNEGTLTTTGNIPDVPIGEARGIGVEVRDNSRLENISNTGTINSVDAGIALDTYDNSSSGNITNEGTIRSDNAGGIYVYTRDNSQSGDVTNSTTGVIEADNIGVYMQATDYSSMGSLINDGRITAEEGIFINANGQDVSNGEITNNGTINSTSYGIRLLTENGATSGNITNSGTLTGSFKGIRIDGLNNAQIGTITNTTTGSIDIANDVSEDYRAGVDVYLENNSSTQAITNAGTINAPEYGIKLEAVDASSFGQVTNSGTITSDKKGIDIRVTGGESEEEVTASPGSVAGVLNSGDITSGWRSIDILTYDSEVGDIINSGTLLSTEEEDGPRDGSENLYITGYRTSFNDVINTGTMEAQGDDTIEVQIYENSSLGDVINDGNLTAHYDGLDVDVYSGSTVQRVINNGSIIAANDGIEVDVDDEGSSVQWIENAGTITGIANENNRAEGMAIEIDDGGYIGTVLNSGTVSVLNNEAIDIEIDNGGIIDNVINRGTVNFRGADLTASYSGIEIELDGLVSFPNEPGSGSSDTINHIEQVINESDGSIEASGRGIYIDLESGSTISRVINEGTITSGHTGIEIDTRDNNIVTDMTLTNSGTVTSRYYDGLTFQGDLNASFTNSGSLTGKQHGLSIYNDRYNFYQENNYDLSVELINSGNITGQSGNGLYITSEVTGNINNSGTIASQSSGDMFADYGVNTNINDYTQLTHESMPEGTTLRHLDGTNWYVLEKTDSAQTLRRFFQASDNTDELVAYIATGSYDEDSDASFRPNDEYTLAFDQIADGESLSVTEYVSQPITISSVKDTGGYEIATPRYINASAIKLTGTLNGDITNSGTLSSIAGAALDVRGSLNGTVYNTGTISGGTLITLPVGNVQWPEGEDVDGPFAINNTFSSMLNNGYYPGLSVYGDTLLLPQSGDTLAIDFSNADTALTLVQSGNAASITGDIWGSTDSETDSITFGDTEAGIGGGSFTGDFMAVENITVTGGNFNFTGNSYEYPGNTNQFTVTSSGTLTLGTHTGTNIQGNYTQAGGLITPVGNVNSAITNEETIAALNVGDTATLSGSMTVNPIWSEFSYSRSTQEKYHVLQANSIVDNGNTLTNQTVLFSQNLTQENDSALYLNMTSNDLETEVESASGNGLYGDLADGLQNALVAQGAQSDLFQALLNVADGQALSDIIEDAVTNNDGSEALLAEALQDGVFNNILGRLAETRSGQGGVSFGDDTPWHGGVWLKALMVRADQAKQRSGSTTFNGYTSNTKGFTLGYDVDISDQWTLGMAWSYADSKMEVKSSSDETTTKSYQLSLYGNWQSGDWFIDTIINMGINKNDSSRVSGGNITYKADFDSKQYGVRVVAGKEFWFNNKNTLLEPQLILNYSHLSTDDYKEKASGMSDISVKSSDYEVLELGAGLRFTHLFELENSILLPEASAKVYYDFKGDTMQQDVNVNILNTSLDYRTTGLETQRMTYQAGAGLSWWLDNNVTLSMNYDRTWRSGFKADAIQAKARYDF